MAGWLLFVVALLLTGLYLTALGFRGRGKEARRPFCAVCSYDLAGLGSEARCPECGSRFRLDQTISLGRRRRRPLIVIAGGLIFLVSLVLLAGLAWPGILLTPLQRLVPESLLVASISRAHPDEFAMVAMQHRFTAGALTEPAQARYLEALFPARAASSRGFHGGWGIRILLDPGTPVRARDAIARRIADVQRDRTAAWDPAWGSAVETAYFSGLMGTGAARAYFESIAEPVLTFTPPRARPGERVVPEVDHQWRGAEDGRIILVRIEPRADAAALGLPLVTGRKRFVPYPPPEPPERAIEVLPECTAPLAPGTHAATLDIHYEVDMPQGQAPIAWTRTVSASLDVAPGR